MLFAQTQIIDDSSVHYKLLSAYDAALFLEKQYISVA